MSTSAERSPRAHIVTAVLRDGDRVLLCHRSPLKVHYPDRWGLPGGVVEPGERPEAALVRELREELGVEVAAPMGAPLRELRGDTFDMQIWLVEAWTGAPVNAAPEEHVAIGWFTADDAGKLPLAHDGHLALINEVLG